VLGMPEFYRIWPRIQTEEAVRPITVAFSWVSRGSVATLQSEGAHGRRGARA